MSSRRGGGTFKDYPQHWSRASHEEEIEKVIRETSQHRERVAPAPKEKSSHPNPAAESIRRQRENQQRKWMSERNADQDRQVMLLLHCCRIAVVVLLLLFVV